MPDGKYIITIGRQVGSGGAVLGKKIADYLGFKYLDREILAHTAKKLNIPEENLEVIEERSFSLWQTMFQASSYDARFMLSDYYLPTGKKLFEIQSQIIKKAAEENSCVIVGRCGSHLFKSTPNSARIFLHADPNIRVHSVGERFQLPYEKAKKEMEQIDRERDRYYETYTGHKRQDVREYDLAIDAGILGPDLTIRTILNYIYGRFPELTHRG